MRYLWQDKKTKIEVEVERKMRDSDVPPDKPEAIEAGMEVEDFAEADWEKVIIGGIGHVGFGQKGSW